MPLDLRGINRMARIRRADDAVDFHRSRSTETSAPPLHSCLTHVLCEAAMKTPWARFAPADALGDRIEDRQMLGVIRQQLAAELERVLADRMGELIHEAFEVDGVMVVVHAAPEVRRDMRVSHGVVDQQVRDV